MHSFSLLVFDLLNCRFLIMMSVDATNNKCQCFTSVGLYSAVSPYIDLFSNNIFLLAVSHFHCNN